MRLMKAYLEARESGRRKGWGAAKAGWWRKRVRVLTPLPQNPCEATSQAYVWDRTWVPRLCVRTGNLDVEDEVYGGDGRRVSQCSVFSTTFLPASASFQAHQESWYVSPCCLRALNHS